MSSPEAPLQLPKIDFSELDPSHPETDAWHAARERVMDALHSYGCFEAVYKRVPPELHEALFGRAMDELFDLPLEVKKKNTSDIPYLGYIGGLPGMAYESLRVGEAPSRHAAESFTRLMWPSGNPAFCHTVWTFSNLLQELEQMIMRMILQSFGIEKLYDSHIASTECGLRLSYYGVPLDQETKIALRSHKDPNIITIICQHEVGGLEVQARDGAWIRVVPCLNSFTIVIGEALEVWTNGRLKAPCHRVKIEANEKRYSALFGSRPREGDIVQTPDELVDEEHPLLFKPYDYNDYLRFRFSEEGVKAKDTLKAFCGAVQEAVRA